MARLFLTQTHLISINEILWCYHSNDISSAERLHKTIFFQHFSRPVPFGQYYIMIEMVLTIQQKSTRKSIARYLLFIYNCRPDYKISYNFIQRACAQITSISLHTLKKLRL